jgi:hypothetical protein
MTDLHPWQVSTKLQPPIENSIRFYLPSAGEEVIRLDKDGFHYQGQFIEDAGEARRLFVEFLRQGTVPALAEQPVGPTDEEIRTLADFDVDFDYYETTDESGNVGNAWECSDSQLLDFARAVLARWGQP